MQAYWTFNDLLVESSYSHFIIDRKEVNELDVTRPRQFFDRLRVTKELAYHCQGKVEISLYGYDQDPRELFEIEAVKQYIALLDNALPELFFFVRTEKPARTIRMFALCLTRVVWESERSTQTVTRRVLYDTNKVEEFLMRHWPRLNEMAEWLSMSIKENKKISFAVIRSLGIEAPDEGGDGKDRMGLFLCYFLMKLANLSPTEAIQAVRHVRPIALSAVGWEECARQVLSCIV